MHERKKSVPLQPLSRGRAAEDDRLAELRLRETVLTAAPSILPCGCARERERVSRTPSENLLKIFFKKNFRKNLEVTKKRLTFANAFPLKREHERKDSSLKDFR